MIGISPLLDYQISFWREKIKPTLNQALERATKDKIDWAPAEKMMTLGMIFLHIAECSDWWYDEIMKGVEATEIAFPDRPCPPMDEIKAHMDKHWERLERFFAEPVEMLEGTYEKKLQTRTIKHDGYWIFTHLLEHDIHHRSQINHYLRILGIDPPEI
jgi:uncharacterized damage-inducible protein DinB